MSAATLQCPKCKRERWYDKATDGAIPSRVARIVVICPTCDDGDFHSETWLDAHGNEVSQDV